MTVNELVLLLRVRRGDFNETILPYSKEACALESRDYISVNRESYASVTSDGDSFCNKLQSTKLHEVY